MGKLRQYKQVREACGHSLGTPTAFGPILALFYSTKFEPSELFYSILVGHSLKNAIFLCYTFFGWESTFSNTTEVCELIG
jgi:hypothetical protein